MHFCCCNDHHLCKCICWVYTVLKFNNEHLHFEVYYHLKVHAFLLYSYNRIGCRFNPQSVRIHSRLYPSFLRHLCWWYHCFFFYPVRSVLLMLSYPCCYNKVPKVAVVCQCYHCIFLCRTVIPNCILFLVFCVRGFELYVQLQKVYVIYS